MSLLLPPATSLDLHLIKHNIQLSGYQLYAVEKWLLQRNRPINLLIVYTGHPSHTISLNAYSQNPLLSKHQAQLQWDNAINTLKTDGARPKQTPYGILMATSLAHFRSDYSIVLIPDGNLSLVRDQLYTNINLLRMGCSGRTALTLQDPSNVTKSRFISAYHLPEAISSPTSAITSTETLALPVSKSRSHSHSRSNSVLSFKHVVDSPSSPNKSSISKAITINNSPSTQKQDSKPSLSLSTNTSPPRPPPFTATVLELVKLIQAGLAIFGMYSTNPSHIDGLLCDLTVDGIHKWILEIGNPCIGLEPMERVADPSFVAALVSLVLSIRNKLAALGFSHLVPKDPFLHPHIFLHALTTCIQSANQDGTTTYAFGSAHSGGHVFTPSIHHLFPAPSMSSNTLPVPPQMTTPSTSGSSASGSNTQSTSTHAVLTRELVTTIGAAYDAKARSADGRGVSGHGGRMRKVLRDKLRPGGGGGGGVESDGDGASGEWAATSGGEGNGAGMSGSSAVTAVTGVDRERETSSGAGGGQILSGIGSIASGLGLGVGAGSSSSNATGAGALMEPTCDMRALVRSIYSKPPKMRNKTIGKMYDVGNVVAAAGGGVGAGAVGGGGAGGAAAAAGSGSGGGGGGGGGESLGTAYNYLYHGREKEKDGGVGVSIKALWSGQVASILALREREVEKERRGATLSAREARDSKRQRAIRGSRDTKDHWTLSDGDLDDHARSLNGPGAAKSDTEEESDPPFQPATFGGMWGEKMQKKLGSWAGIAKKRTHMSADSSTLTSKSVDKESVSGAKYSLMSDALGMTRPDLSRGISMPLSPTLAPTAFSGADGDPDDDDLLSSGQVSPVDNLRPSPFQIFRDGRTLENNNDPDYERKITEFNMKRHWGGRLPQNRIYSWADPVSARWGVLDEEDDVGSSREGTDADGDSQMKTTRKRGNTAGSWLGGGASLTQEPEAIWEEDGAAEGDSYQKEEEEDVPTMRAEMYGPTRRRSFHDLDSLQQMRVLPMERMRIDVDLAGQLLIMSRREQHLRNVLACLQVLTSRLSNTNALLREDHHAHLPVLADLEPRTQIISTIDAENAKTDKTSQATHTLRYEAEQFHIPDLWHTVAPPRQKVLELRGKVFGMGGRRLPQGVHGAHGKFNRLQWTLDGQERLVDHLGRTESEAEEEAPGAPYLAVQEDKEEDVVEHPGIKPMWLLRFFTSWGARWGTSAVGTSSTAPQPGEDDGSKPTSGTATPQRQQAREKDGDNTRSP